MINKFKGDTLKITEQNKLKNDHNISKGMYISIFAQKYFYAIIEIPIIDKDESSYKSFYYIVKFDTSLNCISLNEINDEFDLTGSSFWSPYIYNFTIDEIENILYLPITKGHDNSKINDKDTTLYTLARYKLKSEVFEFHSVSSNKIPKYYIDKQHFYRNIWPKIELKNHLGGLMAFQYLNEIQTFDGQIIKLEGLNIDKLILPTKPGEKSNKPFEIVYIKSRNNVINILIWKNNATWLYNYSNQGVLIQKYKLLKSIVKPAAVITENKIRVIQGKLNGDLIDYTFKF